MSGRFWRVFVGRSIRLDLHNTVQVTQVRFFLSSQVARTGIVTEKRKQEKKAHDFENCQIRFRALDVEMNRM